MMLCITWREQNPSLVTAARPGNGVDRRRRLASQRVGRGIHESVRETSLCDIAVMLHLRACYVSKAAILTMPMQSVSVRKSKSRLNSKGLDR
jgi:hypothetical protein